MTMELMSGFSAEVKQFYDRKLLETALKDTVFLNYGVKRPIPAKGGKSIEFRRFERFTIPEGSYVLTEGTPPSETNASINTVAATISQYGMFSRLSDVFETQSYDPILAEYVEKYGLAMAEGLDIIAREELSNATTLQYADSATVVGTSGAGAVGSGNYLDAAELNEMKRTLRRVGARPAQDGKYICFIHPDNTKDLFEDPDIVDAFQHAAPRSEANPMFTGLLGDWMGIRFVETNNLRVRTSYGMSGADVYEVVVIGNEAYGSSELSALAARTIIHPRGTGGHTDPLDQYSTVGWKASLAIKILNNDFMGLIYCNSSRTTAA